MRKRVQLDGESYSLFKGKFAKVIFRLDHGTRGLEVRYFQQGRRVKKCFALSEQREANAYARQIEEEHIVLSDRDYTNEEERYALGYYRKWEARCRLEGRTVPPLFELIQEACERYDKRTNAATWESAAATYMAERGVNLKPARASVVRSVIARFTDTLARPDLLLDDITIGDVQEGITAMLGADASRGTRGAYLAILSSIWQLAIDRKLAGFNPASEARKQLPPAEVEQPTFFSVEECRKLLAVAWQHGNRAEALFFVVGLLTGIRLAERARLQYEDFRLDEPAPYINVPAGKAKTRRQRAVYLQGTHADIIRAFLPAGAAPADCIAPYGGNETTQRGSAYATQTAFAKAAGVEFPRNVLRHTAATYLCAHLESMGKAALILGHSEDILTRHYRALVTKAEADKFFALTLPPN